MKVLVDADSCPRQVRDLILRRSLKNGFRLIFAANRSIPNVNAENVTMEICPGTEGSADNRIVELAEKGDLAVTRDIPLAKRLIEIQTKK